jgi:hypothetical protein
MMKKPMKVPADWPKTVTLKCEKCGATQTAPVHCGKPMNLKKVGGKDMLVCWMSETCGKAEVPIHHGKPMKIVTT